MRGALKLVSRGVAAVLAVGLSHAAFAFDALSDTRFVSFVQQANDFGIDSSRMALQKSESDKILEYAKRIVAERREIAVALSRARSEARVGYAPSSGAVRPRHIAVLDRLSTLEGEKFDKAYTSAQLAAQIEAVDEVDAYAQTGGNADLRRFALETLPRLQSELEHAKRIAAP